MDFSEKIIELAQKDLDLRKNYLRGKITKQELKKEDLKIQGEIISIIEDFGLITIKDFGWRAAHSAWLLIQHLPKERISYKEKYLALMENNLELIDLKDYAYLKDRVRIDSQELQIYGTQLKALKNNILRVYPILNPKELDIRRQEAGLEPFASYISRIEETSRRTVVLG